MVFAVFFIAWLVLLVLFISTGGEPEANPLTAALGWLCIAVVFGCAVYAMSTGSLRGGVAMIGSLAVLAVRKQLDGQ